MQLRLAQQIASQPTAIRQLLENPQEIPTLDLSRPIILTGLGTSLHACQIAEAWIGQLSRGKVTPIVISAHDLALSRPIGSGDQVILVSHRGTKTYPNAVLDKAGAAGARTIIITSQEAPTLEDATVLRTCSGEQSGTHTVSYTTALTVLGQIVSQVFGQEGKDLLNGLKSLPEALERTLELPAPVEIARRLENTEPILVSGFGLDAITASEAALKIKEGTYLWAEGLPVELALHGPPGAFRARMGAITFTPGLDDGGRIEKLRKVLEIIGATALTCGSENEDLRYVGVEPLVRPLISIVPVQRLVLELAKMRGTNPDEIHRDLEPWKTAMASYQL